MPANKKSHNCLLMVDDDADDQYMMRQVFLELKYEIDIQTANDGFELFDYLNKRGKFENISVCAPRIILLDLNMPKKDGRDSLKEIKSSPLFSKIPVIVFSTSRSQEDIDSAYELGASNYIVKPDSYTGLLETMTIFYQYWFGPIRTPEVSL